MAPHAGRSLAPAGHERIGRSSCGGQNSGRNAVAEGLITPDELRRIADDKEMEKAKEALEKQRRMDEERHHFRDTFM